MSITAISSHPVYTCCPKNPAQHCREEEWRLTNNHVDRQTSHPYPYAQNPLKEEAYSWGRREGRGRTYNQKSGLGSVAQKYPPSPVSNVFTGTKLLPKNRMAMMAPNQPIHWVACSGVSHAAPQRDMLTEPPFTAFSATQHKDKKRYYGTHIPRPSPLFRFDCYNHMT